MIRAVLPGARSGSVNIPASKSQAHRILICAALSGQDTDIICRGISNDISATMDCLNAMGSDITADGNGKLLVRASRGLRSGIRRLHCGESGSTLRFLLPVVGSLGIDCEFIMEGRLPDRPLAPLDSELLEHGMDIEKDGNILRCSGALQSGHYTIPGNVSSQYISGLLMALPLLEGDSVLEITGTVESADYISMTEQALGLSGISFEKSDSGYSIPGRQRYRLSRELTVEGDYSSAAFFLCMGALSDAGVTVRGLDLNSLQGDRRITDILTSFGAIVSAQGDGIMVRRGGLRGMTVDAAMIPDLIPVLSVVAAASEGETRFVNAGRLRLKESDRLESTFLLLSALGADIEQLESGLIIRGKPRLSGGRSDSFGDHRIAMSAAVAACVCDGPVTISGAECVSKSYPRFWWDFDSLEVC